MPTTIQLLDFNRAVALDRVGGDEELLQEVAELYLSEYPSLVDQIQTAVSVGNADDLHHLAHTLKGSLGTLGAECAAAQALSLEMMGRNHDLSGAHGALAELHGTLERFHSELYTALR
jgi:HPt (histidine-containing phosphotransfer) domain-containing protein